MPSLFHVFTVVDYEPVGNDVITNLLRKVLWEDVMRTQVHEAFVGGEMILTQVHDTSVFFEPSYHDKDVMYLNKNGVADNDDYPLNLVISAPALIDMHDRRVLTRSCLMCGTDHVSWNEEFDRRLVYGEHRALLSDGKHSTGRELLSLGNGSCCYYDGLTETPSSFTVVFDDALTYGDGKGRSYSEDVISREFAASTWVPEWGEHEGVLTKQEQVRGEYLAIDRRTIVLRNVLVGIDDPYGLMSYEEHESCNNGVGNSMYSWGATFRMISRIYAATISVTNGRSLLQVNNSRGSTDVLFGDSNEAILDGELVGNVTTHCTARSGSDESSCTDSLSFMDCNDWMSPGWTDSMQQNDSAKQSLLSGAASTRSMRGVYDESCNDVLANDDCPETWSIGDYFEYTTCGDDELSFGMDEVTTPQGTVKDLLYFVAVNSNDNRVGIDGSSNPHSTVLDTRYAADSDCADCNCMLVGPFCGESSDTNDDPFDAAVYTARSILERARAKSISLYLEVLSQSLHLRASCHGPGVNDSIRKFLGKRLHDYNQHQVTTALQATASKSSVYILDTSSSDIQTYEHMTANTTDFMPRFVMRYFDRVSRNDGGDTLLIDESVLVDIMDTTYLMENSEIIYDDEYVLMAAATSGMNGEPYTPVHMTSNTTPDWINANVFKSSSIWGAWLSDVIGKCWKINAVTGGEIMEDILPIHGDSSIYGEESRDGVDGSSNTVLGFNQSNDAAYFSDIKDEHHGVVDLTSSVPVWHLEVDGMQSLFGLESRRAMGRFTLQKINGDSSCLRRHHFVEELQEQYEGIQCSIKSTAENVNFIQDNISSTGNRTNVHLHRTFLSRGASLPNLRAALSIYIFLHDRLSCGTIAMNDGKSCATGIAYWGDGDTSSLDACNQDTTWEAVDKSSSIVFNTSAASIAMFCVSLTFMTTLLRRLHRLPIDFFDGGATSQLSSLDRLYVGDKLETAEPISAECSKNTSCTSPVNGERFACRLDKAIHVRSIQDNDISIGNYSRFYSNPKRQLMNWQNIYADGTACTSMQQLMGPASCLPRCRPVIMSIILARHHALPFMANTAELESRIFAMRSAMIYRIGHCYGDVQYDCWQYFCASVGLLVGLLLLLRCTMGSHILQIVDSKAGYDIFFNLCHGKLSRRYVNGVLHSFSSKALVDCVTRKRSTHRKLWIRWTIRPNLATRNVLEEGYYEVNIQEYPILSTNTTNRRGVTEWVRVLVDTDSMSTINTGTFRGIGTQSSSITSRMTMRIL